MTTHNGTTVAFIRPYKIRIFNTPHPCDIVNPSIEKKFEILVLEWIHQWETQVVHQSLILSKILTTDGEFGSLVFNKNHHLEPFYKWFEDKYISKKKEPVEHKPIKIFKMVKI